MGGRTILLFAAAALLLVGLCGVAITRLGGSSERVASGELLAISEDGDSDSSRKEPLQDSATYLVSEQLEGGVSLLPHTRGIVDQLNDPEVGPQEDLEVIDELVRVHLTTFESIPQGGENKDIMDQMTGRNARSIAVIPPGHRSLNANGELVDRWGTPYHFHPVSRSVLEVRSAGPDRQLWSDDDIFLSAGGD